MKPKSASCASAFAIFKQNRINRKKEKSKGTSLTPGKISFLKKAGMLVEHTPSLNESSLKSPHKSPASTKVLPLKSSTPTKALSQASPPLASNTSKRKKTNLQNSAIKEKECQFVPCGNPNAQKCFAWLIHPISIDNFFKDIWEKKSIYLKRKKSYYNNAFGCSEFDKILRTNHLEYNTNIDVVSYEDGVRKTHNPDGRAYASVIWSYYQSGSSIRLLNPQTYSRAVWDLCSMLGEFFGDFCGANMYLTPPGSQGFAPHYDDIEAFVLQLEGKKMWKVYSPRFPNEELPRTSSCDFSQSDLGDPILEITLQPGDFLYMPRGFIHQAQTTEDAHSLHITLSTYQKHTWGDFLMKLLPKAINDAMESDIEYRQSLPINYLDDMGMDAKAQEFFTQKLIHLTKRLTKYLSPDAVADLTAKEYIHSALPPCLTREEESKSIHGNGEHWENGGVINSYYLKPNAKIRFIRKRAVRLIREDDMMKLYHSFENSRVYREREPQYVVIEWELIPAVELLLETCPKYVKITDLPLSTLDEKMNIANLLYDKGLLETKCPLPPNVFYF